MSVKQVLRRMRAKVTGRRPCTFETAHGHDMHFLYGVGKGMGRHLIFECKTCGQNFSYSPIFGLEKQ